MVHLTALGSFFLATWGFALFSNPVLTPARDASGKAKEGSWEEIEERKAKVNLWYKGNGDEPSPLQAAANWYHQGRGNLFSLEVQVPANQKYYKDELEILKSKATEKDPAMQLKLVGGHSVAVASAKMVPVQKEPTKDIDGLDMPSLEALAKRIDELSKELLDSQIRLSELSKESKLLVDKQADTMVKGPDGKDTLRKGIQTIIEDEKRKRALIAEEFGAIQQALVNISIETEDLWQRRRQLDKRIVELRDTGLTTVP